MFVINYLTNLDLEKYDYILGISGDYIDDVLIEIVKKLELRIVYFPCRKKHTIKYFVELVNFIRKERIDAIHIHGNSTTITIDLLAAKIGGCKCRIAHCHNSKCDYKRINVILRPLFRKIYTVGIACSREAAINMFGEADNVYILKNGIDTQKFHYSNLHRNKIRNELNILNSEIVLGHVGAFNNQKNQEFLIALMNKLLAQSKMYKLVLVGEGIKQEEIKKLAVKSKLDDRVLFLGKRDDVADVMNAFDIFVFPSKFEGLGIVAIEAQSVGLPCIVSEYVPYIAKTTTNIEYLKLDVDIWTEKILNGKFEIKTECNREVRENGWDIKNCVEELQKIYYSLL